MCGTPPATTQNKTLPWAWGTEITVPKQGSVFFPDKFNQKKPFHFNKDTVLSVQIHTENVLKENTLSSSLQPKLEQRT